jgi:hypothetical protein
MVWLYPIKLCGELTMVEGLLDICTSMQKHPYTLEEIPPIPTPSLAISLNSPSPSMVLHESLD